MSIPDLAGEYPATASLDRVTALCGAAMRSVVAVVGAVAAVSSLGPPADATWVWAAAAVSMVWAAFFAWRAVTSDLSSPLMAADVVLTTLLCLAQPRLVASAILPGGVSWIAGLATMSIVVANFAWRPPAAVPAGLLVAAAHLVGARLAGASDGGLATAGIQVVQVIATAALMAVLRWAVRDADATLAASRQAQRDMHAQAARLAEEREQNRRLHDTILATLTTVAGGSLRTSTRVLRERAAEELTMIRDTGPVESAREPVNLPSYLRGLVRDPGVPLHWEADEDCWLDAPVAAALAGATVEAVTNVARHARGASVRVRVATYPHAVEVQIADNGPGLDPAQIPAHRYGIREAIIGRMRDVGGDASVESSPAGTTVRLRWTR